MTINVKDYIEDIPENDSGFAYSAMEQEEVRHPYEVGETIFIPFKITEINTKQTGNTVLKQFRLNGPTIDPAHETYTEHRLREIFEAV